jgi:FMN phosphatase YigB (HAD superfamily)
MTSDLLGVTKEQWNEQLLEKSMDRLKGKEKNPFIFVGRMARAINPLIEEEVIRRATEFRVQRMRKAITMIPDSTIQTLQRLKQEGKKLGLLSNADASEILESPIGDP